MQPCQPAGYSTHECAKLSLGNETVEKISIQYYLTLNDKRSRYGDDPSI